jgi:dUTP pyrophosphatase
MIKLLKTREVRTPERGTKVSAGLDFFIPAFTKEFLEDFKSKNPNYCELRPGNYSYYITGEPDAGKILLGSGERLMIPAGIKMNIDPGKAVVMFNKSGISVKKGLIAGACVIDEDYQGEVHISIINTSNHIIEINEGEKIIQGLTLGVSYQQPQMYENEASLFANEVSERGEGGFGSTNK